MKPPAMNIQQQLQSALAHHQAGRLREAEQAYRQVLARDPGNADANNLLGVIAYQDGRFEAAVKFISRAVEQAPNESSFFNNLGNARKAGGDLAGAVAAYKQALGLQPNHADAHYNLGNTYLEQGNQVDAAAAYKRALAVKPDYADAHSNLAAVLLRLGHADQAIIHYQKTLALKPGLADVGSALLCTSYYLPDVSQEECFQAALRWDRHHARPLRARQRPHLNNREKNRRLRVGYVSPDFRFHAINMFFEPLLKAHDRKRFEIFLYANVIKSDDVTRRLQTEADHWLSIAGMSDEEAAERIRADRIDILVDLAKHSKNNRLLLFAIKPAPVQATWLGYPCSTGMGAIDYRIVDGITHPAGKTDHLNSEKLVRLPHGYFCFEPKKNAPEVVESPAGRKGWVTFGSFNNFLKINEPLLAVWAEILSRVPGSRLIIIGKNIVEDSLRTRFFDLFAGQGIEADRVELLPYLPYIEYLAMYGKVDIALDSFPYNGHTTTCDSLWMGLPVITLTGAPDCSRVGASILSRVGLPELIAENRQEYIDKAVQLAQDTGRLSVLRRGMRDRVESSSFRNVKAFAQSMESAYVKMWERYLSEDFAEKNS